MQEDSQRREKLKKKCTMSSGKKTRSRKNSIQEKEVDDVFAALHLLSSSSDEDGEEVQGEGNFIDDNSEDDTTCPKCGMRCGIRYGDSTEKWICCDGCGLWLK